MSSTDVQAYYHTQFTDERIALIKRTIAPTVTNDEFALFIDRCRQTGLDPIARQIYALSRYDRQVSGMKMSIQVSIDGMRLLAERSNKYAGQLGPFWCDESGEWRDVWLKPTPPVAARVGVIRSDFKEPLFAVAKYSSYVQTNKDGSTSIMWTKMPDVLLAKCAESLAIRRAFPMETSGLYTREEMMQADVVESDIVDAPVDRSPVTTNGNGSNHANAPMPALKEPQPATIPTNNAPAKLEPAPPALIAKAKELYDRIGRPWEPAIEQKSALAVRGLMEQASGMHRDQINTDNGHAPSEDAKAAATPEQLASIRQLCQRIGKSDPDNVTSLSSLAAKKLIQELTAEYKASRQPTSTVNSPSVANLRKRALAMQVDFDDQVVRECKKLIADDNITPEIAARLKQRLDIIAQQRTNKPVAEQKAS